MNMKYSLELWKLRLKSVPQSFVAYKKNSVSAIDEAKRDRRFFAPLVFIVILFFSSVFLIAGHLRGVDYNLSTSKSILNDMGLLKYVQTFSVGVSFMFGFVLTFIMFFVYVLTRFVCVKLFARGSRAKIVFADSIIEFGMNSIPLIVFFVFGGVLGGFVWWSFYLLVFFVFLFFIVMLMRGILDAVDREKQTSTMMFVTALFVLIALALILALIILALGYVIITIALGVNSNIHRIIKNFSDKFEYILRFFAGIGDWFKGVFSR